jgi:dipeptidyl aminopeptidase/acylaminoacyl peptidase
MEPKTFRFPAFLTIGLILALLWSAHPLQAATNIRVSGVMPSFGDVGNFQISPDGRYAVYVADQDTDGVFELYSVFLGGGSPVRLNPLLPFGRNVTSFQISPDSSRVVYLADQEKATVVELYSVAIGGPAAAGIKLNGALAAGGLVDVFLISPDSSRVVYIANQEKAFVFELYSVPLGGPAAAGIKLNGPLVLNGIVTNFRVSPDSGRVLYIADQDTDNVFELYMTSNYLLHLPLILRQG